ncbi:MAG: hypothetical protein U1F35_22660 [Steroidobacteraceae bacterium]
MVALQNQQLAREGSSSTKASGQALNAVTTSRYTFQPVVSA